MVAVSLTTAVLVAVLSSVLGESWALREVDERFQNIRKVIQDSGFPLTATVMQSLADLTDTEMFICSADGSLQSCTLQLTASEREQLSQRAKQFDLDSSISDDRFADTPQLIGDASYLAFSVRRSLDKALPSEAGRVIVLFDRSRVDNARRRATWLPLVTGLSTILLLSTLMIVVANRLVARIVKLEKQVDRVASGDFDSQISDHSIDEVGRLGAAVDNMAGQLRRLWSEINRQQGQRLLHQISSGMAHQLRNTLTGARLAMELHRGSCKSPNEEVDVAIRETENAEDFVRRILTVGVGDQSETCPAALDQCLRDVQASQAIIAQHRRVQLSWRGLEDTQGLVVADRASLVAALSNLVLNAIESGDQVTVEVQAECLEGMADEQQCTILVIDNGPGVPDHLVDEVFEPFVTSKPEGLGLGLPVVRRAAEALGGSVEYRRDKERTEFVLQFQTRRAQSA